MFISASNIVKFHQCADNREDYDVDYPRKTSRIVDLSLCNDNTYVAILHEDDKPQILSMREKSYVHVVHSISAVKDVRCLTFKNHTKRYLGLGTKTGDIFIYDTKDRAPIKRYPNMQKQIEILKFTDSDSELIAACGSSVYILQQTSEENTNSFKLDSKCTALAYKSGEQSILAAGSTTGNIKLWDLNTSLKLSDLQLHMSQVSGLHFSPSKNLLVTAGIDHKACIMNLETATMEFIVSLHNAITCIDLSKDETYLALGLEDGTIYLYDTRHMIHPVQITQSHDSPVNKICFDNEEFSGFEMAEDVSEISCPVTFHDKVRTTGGDCSFLEGKKNGNQISGDNNNSNCNVTRDKPSEGLHLLERELERYTNSEFDDLYCQFSELSGNFQKFLDNEMKSIQNVVQTKRDALVFDHSVYHSQAEN